MAARNWRMFTLTTATVTGAVVAFAPLMSTSSCSTTSTGASSCTSSRASLVSSEGGAVLFILCGTGTDRTPASRCPLRSFDVRRSSHTDSGDAAGSHVGRALLHPHRCPCMRRRERLETVERQPTAAQISRPITPAATSGSRALSALCKRLKAGGVGCVGRATRLPPGLSHANLRT